MTGLKSSISVIHEKISRISSRDAIYKHVRLYARWESCCSDTCVDEIDHKRRRRNSWNKIHGYLSHSDYATLCMQPSQKCCSSSWMNNIWQVQEACQKLGSIRLNISTDNQSSSGGISTYMIKCLPSCTIYLNGNITKQFILPIAHVIFYQNFDVHIAHTGAIWHLQRQMSSRMHDHCELHLAHHTRIWLDALPNTGMKRPLERGNGIEIEQTDCMNHDIRLHLASSKPTTTYARNPSRASGPRTGLVVQYNPKNGLMGNSQHQLRETWNMLNKNFIYKVCALDGDSPCHDGARKNESEFTFTCLVIYLLWWPKSNKTNTT